MRNSNKLLALALAAALALGTTATAFAAEDGKDSKGETTPTNTTAPADTDKKDETTPAGGEEKKDEDTTPADGEEKKDEDTTPADGEEKKDEDTTPADGEEKKDEDTTPADGEDKKDEDSTPADGEDKGEEPAPAGGYTDVTDKNWYYGAVNFVTENKLMDALDENTFGPSEKMTRQMLAVALYRLAGSPEVTAENPFTDVADDAAYKDAVVWAYSVGVVNGLTETTFGPDASIQRQAIAAMLARYLGVDTTEEADLSAFTDAGAIQAYAKGAMSWAAENKLLQGDAKGAVDPRGDATRAQVATILERFAPMAEDKVPGADANTPADDATTPADTDKKDDADKADDADKTDGTNKTDDTDKADGTNKADDADKADDAGKADDADKADDAGKADADKE